MKKIIILLVFSLTICYSHAQVLHLVNSGNYYYTPQTLTINVGDTVKWLNDGGFHNVNFDASAICLLYTSDAADE